MRREFVRDLSRFLPCRQDVRRSRWDVKTGPGDGFEPAFGHLLAAVAQHTGGLEMPCGPLWLMWSARRGFEPWPEMIQGVRRLGRSWVVVLCGQLKC